jgi:hypothetical protein
MPITSRNAIATLEALGIGSKLNLKLAAGATLESGIQPEKLPSLWNLVS